jgi:hypothetical protein
MAQFDCPSMAISDQTKKVLLFSLIAISSAVGLFLWHSSTTKRDAAERDTLLAHFEVISDPFARPKIYRHKASNDLNPTYGRKLPHGEISLVTTSDGQVAFLILQEKLSWVPGSPPMGIKILANDEIFELHLSPCLFMPDDKFKYHYPPKVATTWQFRDLLTLEKLTSAIESDQSGAPYLYRVMEREDEQTLTGDQLKAFKETFGLASLLRK